MGHSASIWGCFIAALCVGVGGCATCPEKIRTALSQPVTTQAMPSTSAYALGCPDRISIQIADRPSLTGTYTVEADGCVALGQLGRVRVEGQTTSDVEQALAQRLRVPGSPVKVAVEEYASRHLLIFGPADGVQRVIPYQGAETVTELLRRTGGLADGAAFNSVFVVRPHVADGRRPEVFPVDLNAIFVGNNTQSDVRLEAYDQIYLGETRGASVARCMPPWLRIWLPGAKPVDSPAIPGENSSR